jgi:hypothetical protein
MTKKNLLHIEISKKLNETVGDVDKRKHTWDGIKREISNVWLSWSVTGIFSKN